MATKGPIGSAARGGKTKPKQSPGYRKKVTSPKGKRK